MILRFDPGQIDTFKQEIKSIPGYPTGEELPIQALVFESNALFRLPELLTAGRANLAHPLLVVMDHTPMRRGEADLKPLLVDVLQQSGWTPRPLWLEADASGQVHTDFSQIEFVKAALNENTAVLSVGSGVVTDVAKHACYLFEQEAHVHIPFIVYQTANSVSAYTSNMAPVFVEGVKRTLPSRYPDVLVCDLETLRDAPREMTVAGVGDLLAAFSSFADWYLAYRLGLDPSYTEFAQILLGPLDDIFLAYAPALREGTLDSMEVLAKLISLAGIAMSLSHATAPLSGFEHVISHVLDLLAEQEHQPLAQHGTQVALATLLSTASYQKFLTAFEPDEVNLAGCYPSSDQMKKQIETAFASIDPSGKVARECWSDYEQKLTAWHANRLLFEAFLRDWPNIRTTLEQLTRPPGFVMKLLRAIDSPVRFDQLSPPVEMDRVKFAYFNAPLIRKRLTLGDLFIFLDWDREALWD
ncbi:MAG TPA: iron-containing alcohol dehydrogenase [Anaerolineales bacterium]|nr:iron-containing alcohol dehydrogenase [Anaerolineales bacterium]